ncbi:hypothetical protein K490DRAFT_58621 [Saccharata proteae CBS 121410]|uniref:Uncharacterized protein n=1 Tax=Saccharata proteae CBS 121410 TaxID=1314787 RepID=A0A9P4LV02_9PEZI|nr:hypothetical protein K490DRAFT_58621 [Saccharata proteae CBS 121410]
MEREGAVVGGGSPRRTHVLHGEDDQDDRDVKMRAACSVQRAACSLSTGCGSAGRASTEDEDEGSKPMPHRSAPDDWLMTATDDAGKQPERPRTASLPVAGCGDSSLGGGSGGSGGSGGNKAELHHRAWSDWYKRDRATCRVQVLVPSIPRGMSSPDDAVRHEVSCLRPPLRARAPAHDSTVELEPVAVLPKGPSPTSTIRLVWDPVATAAQQHSSTAAQPTRRPPPALLSRSTAPCIARRPGRQGV